MNPLFSKDQHGRTIRDLIQGTINQIQEEEVREVIFLGEPYYEIEGAMSEIDATSASLGKNRGLSVLRQLFVRLLEEMDARFEKNEATSAKAASEGVFKFSDYTSQEHLPFGPEGLEQYIDEIREEWREVMNDNDQWAYMSSEAERLYPDVNIQVYWKAVLEVDAIAEALGPKVLEETVMNERLIEANETKERILRQKEAPPLKLAHTNRDIVATLGPNGLRLV